MSTIENTNTVDAVGVDKATGIVVLKIFDHLGWTDEHSHLLLLQGKINSYLNFMESGEIFDAYPESKNRDLQIDISFLEKPSENCLIFFETVSKIFLDAWFSFVFAISKP